MFCIVHSFDHIFAMSLNDNIKKTNKMKTAIYHAAAESFELVKRALYSFEVLIIGLLIPVLFVVGTNTNIGDNMNKENSISKPHQENVSKSEAGLTHFLSDKNS